MEKKTEEGKWQCICCYEEDVTKKYITKCAHSPCCVDCIEKWMETNPTCPICRTVIGEKREEYTIGPMLMDTMLMDTIGPMLMDTMLMDAMNSSFRPEKDEFIKRFCNAHIKIASAREDMFFGVIIPTISSRDSVLEMTGDAPPNSQKKIYRKRAKKRPKIRQFKRKFKKNYK